MELIGHRGCPAHNPENTIPAVRAAATHLPTVEVDVRRCGSGHLVAHHDPTVDRLTDATGDLTDYTLPELQQLTLTDTDATIPHLPDLIDAVPSETRIQLELKELGLAPDVLTLIADIPNPVRITSFLSIALATIRDHPHDVPTGYLFSEPVTNPIQTARTLECATLHPPAPLCQTTDIVADAHAAGLDVIAWQPGETAVSLSDLAAHGVDGITVDTWDVTSPQPTS